MEGENGGVASDQSQEELLEETAEDDEPITEEETGKMLKSAVKELEVALKVTADAHSLLAERDGEVETLKQELNRYKQQVVKEMANKTRLAQSLDDSHKHAVELEESLEEWQITQHESQQQVEQLKITLHQERIRFGEMEQRFGETLAKKKREQEQLTAQLVELRSKDPRQHHGLGDGKGDIDSMQLNFLKQAVHQLLIGNHAEEHLRAILSILKFTPQERKAVYARFQEKRRRGL